MLAASTMATSSMVTMRVCIAPAQASPPTSRVPAMRMRTRVPSRLSSARVGQPCAVRSIRPGVGTNFGATMAAMVARGTSRRIRTPPPTLRGPEHPPRGGGEDRVADLREPKDDVDAHPVHDQFGRAGAQPGAHHAALVPTTERVHEEHDHRHEGQPPGEVGAFEWVHCARFYTSRDAALSCRPPPAPGGGCPAASSRRCGVPCCLAWAGWPAGREARRAPGQRGRRAGRGPGLG